MNNTYEWLYDNYAATLIKEIHAAQDKAEEQLAEALHLSRADVLMLDEVMGRMRLDWGAEIFSLGFQLGARLRPQN